MRDISEDVASDQADDLRATLEISLGFTFSQGNRIEVLRNGDEIFPAMLSAINQATQTIEFLTFVYWSGDVAVKFAQALASRAADGLEVKVLLDAFGAAKVDRALVKEMRDAGVEVRWFRPLKWWRFGGNNERTHRKLLICDGCIGFTGGVGIAAEWEGNARNPSEWRDTHFRIEGAAVPVLRSAFVGNWAENHRWKGTGTLRAPNQPEPGSVDVLVVRSVASQHWSDIATAMRPLLDHTRERLRITTPYFIPDEALCQDLIDISSRGANVQILTSGKYNDHPVVRWAGQRYYSRLLAAGVEILEYHRTMLHAKVITIDGVWCCVGSANFNQRSLGKDDEVCLICADHGLVSELDSDFDSDCSHAKQIDRVSWQQRGWVQKSKEQLARLIDSHL